MAEDRHQRVRGNLKGLMGDLVFSSAGLMSGDVTEMDQACESD